MAWSSAIKLVGTSIMIPLGYSFGGVHGALIGFVLADVAKYSVVLAGLNRVGVRVLSQDLRLSVLWMVGALAAAATTTLTEPIGADFLSLALRALLVALTSTVIWAPAGMRYLRERRGQASAA
jgi:hypothetical protein